LTIKAIFAKTGDMRYISHLDLMRLFQRAMRRASLPAAFTKGFSPHIKVSLKRALKLGEESGAEEAAFYLDSMVAPEEFTKAMNSKLPAGVNILKTEYPTA